MNQTFEATETDSRYVLECVIPSWMVEEFRKRESEGYIQNGGVDDLLEDLATYPVPVDNYKKLLQLSEFSLPEGVLGFRFKKIRTYVAKLYGKEVILTSGQLTSGWHYSGKIYRLVKEEDRSYLIQRGRLLRKALTGQWIHDEELNRNKPRFLLKPGEVYVPRDSLGERSFPITYLKKPPPDFWRQQQSDENYMPQGVWKKRLVQHI